MKSEVVEREVRDWICPSWTLSAARGSVRHKPFTLLHSAQGMGCVE